MALTGFHRVDDILVYDSDIEIHADHVRQFLQRCNEQQITLNACRQVTMCQVNHHLHWFRNILSGLSRRQQHHSSNLKLPTPSCRTDLRSFFRLMNQLSTSTASVATLLAPLRPLLSTKNKFVWTPNLNQVLSAVKQALTLAPILACNNSWVGGGEQGPTSSHGKMWCGNRVNLVTPTHWSCSIPFGTSVYERYTATHYLCTWSMHYF